jgi:hypothetical protein
LVLLFAFVLEEEIKNRIAFGRCLMLLLLYAAGVCNYSIFLYFFKQARKKSIMRNHEIQSENQILQSNMHCSACIYCYQLPCVNC